MTRRGFGKKGAESESSLGVIIAIVLAVVLLIGIGYFYFAVYSEGSSTANTIKPEDLEIKIQSCAYIDVNIPNTYCNDFDKIKVRNDYQYLSCKHPDVEKEIKKIQTDQGFIIPTCSGTEAREFCITLIREEPTKNHNNTVVDGKTCEALLTNTIANTANNDFNSIETGTLRELSIKIRTLPIDIETRSTQTVEAIVTNMDNTPQGNKRVSFSISSSNNDGQSSYSNRLETTKSDGVATITFEAPSEIGMIIVTAWLEEDVEIVDMVHFNVVAAELE